MNAPALKQIPAIWVYTTGNAFNAPRGSGYAAWLTPDQAARLERIRQARMLFDGRHREYFVGENRTQYDFAPQRNVNGTVKPAFVHLNVLKLISKKIGDLMFGEPPTLGVPEGTPQAVALAALADRSGLQSLFRTAATECSYEAECFLEACLYKGQVYLQRIPADEIFPVGKLQPDRQYASYVRYATANIGTEEAKIILLLETTYAAGSITRKVYQVDSDGKRREVDLKIWPTDPGEPPLAPETKTGITDNTVTWIPNDLVRDQAVSTYDGLIEQQDLLNAKHSQVAHVLALHADPAMAFPEDAFDEQGNVRGDYKMFAYRDPKMLPTYIVWQAQLEAAMQDRRFTLTTLLILAEMAPELLGMKEGAAPETVEKLRLAATNTLAMIAGKATEWAPRLRRALSVAQQLEQTIPGTRYDVAPIGVTIRDGIPVDETSQANVQATLKGAGLISLEGAVEQRLPDPAAAKKEIDRIKQNAAEAMPTVFGGMMASPAQQGSEVGVQGLAQQQQEAA